MSIVHVCVFCVCLSFARSLLAFKRVTLDAGASEMVEIPLTRDEMEFYDDDMVLRVVPGDYTLSVGGSSYSAAQVRNVLCSFQLSFFGEAIVYPGGADRLGTSKQKESCTENRAAVSHSNR